MIGLAGWTVELAEWSSVVLAAVPEATMPAVVAAVSRVAMTTAVAEPVLADNDVLCKMYNDVEYINTIPWHTP